MQLRAAPLRPHAVLLIRMRVAVLRAGKFSVLVLLVLSDVSV